MPLNVLYSASATATGGRDGQAATADGALAVRLSMPRELGGDGREGNNPEQLFAAGYAACFLSALKMASVGRGPRVPPEATVTATIGIGQHEEEEGGLGLAVELAVSLPGVGRAAAAELVERAHRICPYSNATRNNVEVRLLVA